MTVEPMPSLFKVDALTCMSSAGADWYPRRDIETGLVHWFYGPRLRNSVNLAAWWCANTVSGSVRNARLSEDLTGGTPCPECTAKWSMT